MKRVHVKAGMKKALAFSLAAAMVVPGTFWADGSAASAAESTPEPAVLMGFERGFRADGLEQAEVGFVVDMIEKKDAKGANERNANGDFTGASEEVDYVVVKDTFDPKRTDGREFYQTTPIPAGEKKQYIPDFADDTGNFMQFHGATNQSTVAFEGDTYNSNGTVKSVGKGNVFWLNDTAVNESYPTYATTVNGASEDWMTEDPLLRNTDGTWETDENVLFKDKAGQYQEFGLNNSATLIQKVNNPNSPGNIFKTANASGLAFSAWVKNTTNYIKPVVTGTFGDIDGNPGVTATDAQVLLQYDVGLTKFTNAQKAFADVNNDGEVSSVDAQLIMQKDVGLIEEFPAVTAGVEPVIPPEEEELLEETEFFSFERRANGTQVKGADGKPVGTKQDIVQRQYLYFSTSGVTYVEDFNDETKACVWKVNRESLDRALDLLNPENGQKWLYVSYTFDGENFHMFVNGQEIRLDPDEKTNYTNNIMEFVNSDETFAYLGGYGGGVKVNGKDNFNTYRMDTSSDYYMDDIAIYTQNLTGEQVAQAYTAAKAKMESEMAKTPHLLKTYSFSDDSEWTKVGTGSNDRYAVTIVDGAAKTAASTTSAHGGVQLNVNPFALSENESLTGVTLSYWMRRGTTNRGALSDGVLLSFSDEPKACTHPKVSDNYTGQNGVARTQLYINSEYVANFTEGQTKAIGTASLKNIFTYTPYRFGKTDVSNVDEDTKKYDKGTYAKYKEQQESIANKWVFVTVTINNSGIKMYMDGKEVENKKFDFKGARFDDAYWARFDMSKDGTNNATARSLMDFMTSSDTKVYLGFAYGNDESSYLASSICEIDDLSFWDADMNNAEVKALYEQVKNAKSN